MNPLPLIKLFRKGNMSNLVMPVIFIGHGSPMNAVEDNEYSRGWEALCKQIPRPKGILCISAHWETRGVFVTATEHPSTIYDFYGFPDELYTKTYPAPGSRELAEKVKSLVNSGEVEMNDQRGLDHGAWSVLCRLYPRADIPVIQLSLDRNCDAEYHYRVGQELANLREDGYLILGSGNIVHNLRLVQWVDSTYDWASEFDTLASEWMESADHESLIHYERSGELADLAINSAEHYLPLLYVLGAGGNNASISYINSRVTIGSISMRCVILK
jgi:4,5-DOPA dioxygenase extradiol